MHNRAETTSKRLMWLIVVNSLLLVNLNKKQKTYVSFHDFLWTDFFVIVLIVDFGMNYYRSKTN